MSAYHYAAAVDIGLITCSNFNASTLMIRDYWKAPWSALFRHLSISIVYVFLGFMLNYQRRRLDNPEWQPPLSRTNFAILLLASCFLDSDFRVCKQDMNDARLDNIGRPMGRSMLLEYWIYIPNVIFFAIGFFKNVIQCSLFVRRRNMPEKPAYTYFAWLGIFLLEILVLIWCLATQIYCWMHNQARRRWVNKSGWMEFNDERKSLEDDWTGTG